MKTPSPTCVKAPSEAIGKENTMRKKWRSHAGGSPAALFTCSEATEAFIARVVPEREKIKS